MTFQNPNTDSSHNESVISQFTKQATPFAELSEHSNRYGLELIVDLAKPEKSDTVLDVACGPGIVACELAKLVSHVTGIDITPAMIEQAKQLQNEKKLNNLTWKIGDILKTPFDDASFSLIITRYSFHHLLEPKKVLEKMMRVAKPDGRIIIIDVTPESSKANEYNNVEKLRDPSHVKAHTFIELSKMMEEIGLVNLETRCQNLEMDLDKLLEASFPPNGNKEKILYLFKEDLQKDNLGMKSFLKENEYNKKIYFYFPISMLLGYKK
ncbi:MAG TPA: methyltransferase domain-containing protein [Nitrososphaeraceae archaeon]|nr:methyltransferase domain-containing protein [Nitrososphaeraceae archaeon]